MKKYLLILLLLLSSFDLRAQMFCSGGCGGGGSVVDGTYSPTITAQSNITINASYPAYYFKSGTHVIVTGGFNATFGTANGVTGADATITLPVASAFSVNTKLLGVCVTAESAALGNVKTAETGFVIGQVSDHTADVSFVPQASAGASMGFTYTFSYEID